MTAAFAPAPHTKKGPMPYSVLRSMLAASFLFALSQVSQSAPITYEGTLVSSTTVTGSVGGSSWLNQDAHIVLARKEPARQSGFYICVVRELIEVLPCERLARRTHEQRELFLLNRGGVEIRIRHRLRATNASLS